MRMFLIVLGLLAAAGCASNPDRSAERATRSLDPLTEDQIRREEYLRGYRDGQREQRLRRGLPPAEGLPPPPAPPPLSRPRLPL